MLLNEVSGMFLQFNCSIGPEHPDPDINQPVRRYYPLLAHNS